jgi:hypothetical protein
MKLIPAVSLAVSLVRAAGAAAAHLTPAHVPLPPPGYYGDYGPPLRYLRALSGRGSPRIPSGRLRHPTNSGGALFNLWSDC